jgi:hypothetical protein
MPRLAGVAGIAQCLGQAIGDGGVARIQTGRGAQWACGLGGLPGENVGEGERSLDVGPIGVDARRLGQSPNGVGGAMAIEIHGAERDERLGTAQLRTRGGLDGLDRRLPSRQRLAHGGEVAGRRLVLTGRAGLHQRELPHRLDELHLDGVGRGRGLPQLAGCGRGVSRRRSGALDGGALGALGTQRRRGGGERRGRDEPPAAAPQQPVVEPWRRTETGEASRWQGATTANTGSI